MIVSHGIKVILHTLISYTTEGRSYALPPRPTSYRHPTLPGLGPLHTQTHPILRLCTEVPVSKKKLRSAYALDVVCTGQTL